MLFGGNKMIPVEKKNRILLIGLSRTRNQLYRELDKVFSAHDITQTQFAILEVLYSKGDLMVGEIQEKILSTPGNVPYVISNLLAKGYVTKVQLQTDKRCSSIGLSEAGKNKIEEVLPDHNMLINRLFECLNDDEKNQLIYLLDRFRR